jgi:hypothetical protein
MIDQRTFGFQKRSERKGRGEGSQQSVALFEKKKTKKEEREGDTRKGTIKRRLLNDSLDRVRWLHVCCSQLECVCDRIVIPNVCSRIDEFNLVCTRFVRDGLEINPARFYVEDEVHRCTVGRCVESDNAVDIKAPLQLQDL